MPPAKSNRFTPFYTRLAAFNVENLFVRKKEPGPRRTVFINQELPDDYYDHKKRVKRPYVYATNQVITSKYTIITFLPRNLLEQFRRIANIFFLGIAILQFFNKFSTISPGLVILPLLVVLGITAIKDGYEDIKRHQSDRRVNYTTVCVLEGGDFVNQNAMKRKSRTFVRAIVPNRLLHTAKKPNAPDVEKAEANPTQELSSPDPMPQRLPETDLDDDVVDDEGGFFSSAGNDAHQKPHWKRTIWEDVRVGDIVKIVDNESFPADILICATSEDENVAFVETKNLDGETNLKSRTAVSSLTHLRSAAECAKKESRFSVDLDRPDTNMFKLNATVRQEGRLNEDGEKEKEQVPADIGNMLLRGTVLRNTAWVIGVVLFTGEDTKIVLNSGGTPSKRSKVERQMNPQVFLNLILLAMMAVTCAIVDSVLEHRDYPRGAPWLYAANQSDDNPSINGLVTWAFALITFQNIVPISLYISIEAVRTCQALFIYFDTQIFYAKTGQATLARSWNLSDDLGQIEYIFSDKTGTLTQNKMVFRQCSIGAKVYIGDPDEGSPEQSSSSSQVHSTANDHSSSSANSNPSDPSDQPSTKKESFFHSPELTSDLQEALHSSASSPNASHARVLNGFFSVLALCHTVLTNTNKETGKLEYKAQSPDEEALVRAAADVGYVFRGRDREILYLETPTSRERIEAEANDQQEKDDGFTGKPSSKDKYEKYELLNILEFNSARKRMSVVVRKLDGDKNKLFLLTKGADNVIFERLKKDVDEPLKQQTEMHLSEFANQGLRTLTLAYKVVSEEEYENWSERYHEATVTMENREERIDEVSDELEQDLRLLGATAIEDSLQDGVPETIADLKKAGIKVWVATGDKLETAIAIGHSTNLISRESNIIVIRGDSRPVFDQIIGAIEEFFPDSGILDETGVPLPARPSLHRRSISGSSAHEARSRPRPQRRQSGVTSIVGSDNGERPGGFVLVIDGVALGNALSDETNKDLLLRLAMLCEGVICCRVSPLQKALVVLMVKHGLGAMTLAIGDGANDVSMIQAADVGVGIAGEEGLQAVNSSDYAIAQFWFLKRLILVHGHWSYARNGNMILNFFYKNIVCIGVLWWFQIYDAWSSAYAFEYTYLIFWNAFWTLCPVIAIGIFDRIVDDHVLMDLPELYRYGREGTWFGMKWFILYMLDGVYQSAIIFFLICYTYQSTPTTRTDGYNQYLFEFSTTMVFAAVITANLFNGLNTSFWSAWVFFAVFIGIVLVWVYTAIYNIISPGWFVTPVYGNNHILFHSAYFWLCLPLTIVLALAPRYIFKAWKFIWAPDDIDIMRWQVKIDPHNRNYAQDAFANPGLHGLRHPTRQESSVPSSRRNSNDNDSTVSVPPPVAATASASGPQPNQSRISVRSASRVDMSTGLRSVHRGFDFSVEEGGPGIQRIQTGLSERRISRLGLGSLRLKRRSGGIDRALSMFKKKS